jgi:hypothetical protein
MNTGQAADTAETLTYTEKSLLASAAAHESWARTPDRSARTLPARLAMYERWERMADPDGVLPPVERARRAENFRQAHYKRMAAKSVMARRRRRAGVRP